MSRKVHGHEMVVGRGLNAIPHANQNGKLENKDSFKNDGIHRSFENMPHGKLSARLSGESSVSQRNRESGSKKRVSEPQMLPVTNRELYLVGALQKMQKRQNFSSVLRRVLIQANRSNAAIENQILHGRSSSLLRRNKAGRVAASRALSPRTVLCTKPARGTSDNRSTRKLTSKQSQLAKGEREQEILRGKKRIDDRLNALFCVTTEMLDDGNCQFRAASHMMFGDQCYHKYVRHKVVKHMVENHQEYDIFFSGESEFQLYIRDMAKERTWGDELCIRAIADCFCCSIHIICSTEANWYLVYEPQPEYLQARSMDQQCRSLLDDTSMKHCMGRGDQGGRRLLGYMGLPAKPWAHRIFRRKKADFHGSAYFLGDLGAKEDQVLEKNVFFDTPVLEKDNFDHSPEDNTLESPSPPFSVLQSASSETISSHNDVPPKLSWRSDLAECDTESFSPPSSMASPSTSPPSFNSLQATEDAHRISLPQSDTRAHHSMLPSGAESSEKASLVASFVAAGRSGVDYSGSGNKVEWDNERLRCHSASSVASSADETASISKIPSQQRSISVDMAFHKRDDSPKRRLFDSGCTDISGANSRHLNFHHSLGFPDEDKVSRPTSSLRVSRGSSIGAWSDQSILSPAIDEAIANRLSPINAQQDLPESSCEAKRHLFFTYLAPLHYNAFSLDPCVDTDQFLWQFCGKVEDNMTNIKSNINLMRDGFKSLLQNEADQ